MYETLVISGGGVNGFELLGALHYLEKKNLLTVQVYSGCSIGSILCYLHCIGYSAYDILSHLLTSNLLQRLAEFDFSKIVNGTGITSYHPLHEELTRLTLDKYDHIPTMKELYDLTGKELYIATFNLTQYKEEYISYKTHPDMRVLDACRASANLPFIFEEFEYDGNLYVDGGVLDCFPVRIPNTAFHKVIGLNVSYPKRPIQRDSELVKKIQGVLFAGIRTTTRRKIRRALKKMHDVVDIEIDGNETFYDFKLEKTRCLDKFSHGYVSAKTYMIAI
jgi:NTE family protein